MKTITRSNIHLPMAAMILAALAVPAAAQKQVPFKGMMQGHDTDIGGPMTAFVVDTSGTGIATHLGQFSFSQENTGCYPKSVISVRQAAAVGRSSDRWPR
jgi:hypothetical protein